MKKEKHMSADTGAGAPETKLDELGNPPASDDTLTAGVINELMQRAEKAMLEREEYLNLAQRVQADFDNFRRRNQNTREDAYNDGVRETLIKFLPVLDNLDRAILAQGDEGSLREGVQLVSRQFNTLLVSAGVEEIKAEGMVFDPNLHNAVMQEPVKGVESGRVTAVLQKGYSMQGRILRHSMVKVSE